jgi:hypothetical protein
VGYITLGKVIDCGIILTRTSGKVVQVDKDLVPRGTTTKIPPGLACERLRRIIDRIKNDSIPTRRLEALRIMGIAEKDKQSYWGNGTLLFTSLSRTTVKKNLKCRS